MKRDIIFAAWSGEELGTLGSNHFIKTYAGKKETEPLQPEIAAYLNMDMIGRLDKQLVLQGVASSSIWPGEIERRNAVIGLPIATSDDTYMPTDATSFYLKGVPILSLFTGAHTEYHTPRDTADTLNYDGMREIARFVALVARSRAQTREEPGYIKVARPDNAGARRMSNVFLGTIPDYATDVKGLLLGGVIGGGPAEQAGLQKGDVIIEIAGQSITNIYDYTYALELLKIGQPAKVVYMRGKDRRETTLTPAARK